MCPLSLWDRLGVALDETRNPGFAVRQVRFTHPNMYHKIEWAKSVIGVWQENERRAQAGIREMLPCPKEPRERHSARAQQEARARGGMNRGNGRDSTRGR